MDQKRQDLRKEQILDAALTVLIQNGYDGSRMDGRGSGIPIKQGRYLLVLQIQKRYVPGPG